MSKARFKSVRSTSCHGSDQLGWRHHPKCRHGRPLCRHYRQLDPKRKVCACDAYLFPHRTGSGLCGDQYAKWAEQYGMTIEEVKARCA